MQTKFIYGGLGAQLLILLTMFIGLLISTHTAPASAAGPGEDCSYGDINCDGQKNVLDTQCVTATAFWQSNLSENEDIFNLPIPPKCTQGSPTSTDLNCDGQINIIDVQISANLAIGNKMSEELDKNKNGIVDACEWPMLCATDSDCVVPNQCTSAFCNLQGKCEINFVPDNGPSLCNDNDPCTLDSCNEEAFGCIHEPIDKCIPPPASSTPKRFR